MKKSMVFLLFSVILLITTVTSSCGKTTAITVDFDEKNASYLFPVTLTNGTVVLCTSAMQEFTFIDDTVSACKVTLTYSDADSAASVVDTWEGYTGIEHAKADGSTVTYDYVIDASSTESSTFSGKKTSEVIAEVEKRGGVVREQN